MKAKDHKSEPTLIKNLLANQHSQLRFILQKVTDLKKLNTIFQDTLNSELAKHCYLVELTEESITLIVDSASWATVLRYSIPDIIKILKIKPEFKTLKSIEFRVTKH